MVSPHKSDLVQLKLTIKIQTHFIDISILLTLAIIYDISGRNKNIRSYIWKRYLG